MGLKSRVHVAEKSMHKISMGDVKAVQSVFTLLAQKMVTTDSEKIGPLFHIFPCDPKKPMHFSC
jgi:hypothetical protein